MSDSQAACQANVSELRRGLERGIHGDAPNHVIEGACGVITLDPDVLVGLSHLVDIRTVEAVIDGAAQACVALEGSPGRIALLDLVVVLS